MYRVYQAPDDFDNEELENYYQTIDNCEQQIKVCQDKLEIHSHELYDDHEQDKYCNNIYTLCKHICYLYETRTKALLDKQNKEQNIFLHKQIDGTLEPKRKYKTRDDFCNERNVLVKKD